MLRSGLWSIGSRRIPAWGVKSRGVDLLCDGRGRQEASQKRSCQGSPLLDPLLAILSNPLPRTWKQRSLTPKHKHNVTSPLTHPATPRVMQRRPSLSPPARIKAHCATPRRTPNRAAPSALEHVEKAAWPMLGPHLPCFNCKILSSTSPTCAGHNRGANCVEVDWSASATCAGRWGMSANPSALNDPRWREPFNFALSAASRTAEPSTNQNVEVGHLRAARHSTINNAGGGALRTVEP